MVRMMRTDSDLPTRTRRNDGKVRRHKLPVCAETGLARYRDRHQARDGAKAEAEAQRKQIEASLDAKLSEAEARIALIKDAAMRDVGQIAEETADLIVQELAGSKADKSAVSAAVKAVRG